MVTNGCTLQMVLYFPRSYTVLQSIMVIHVDILGVTYV